MPVPNVMGVSEIAARLGVAKKTADGIVRAKGFPEGQRLTMGWVWDPADVETWIAKHRPPKDPPAPPVAGESRPG